MNEPHTAGNDIPDVALTAAEMDEHGLQVAGMSDRMFSRAGVEEILRKRQAQWQRDMDFALSQTAFSEVVSKMRFVRYQRGDELRRLAREVPTLTIHGCSVAEWLRERAYQVEFGEEETTVIPPGSTALTERGES